jgi:putative isomerase
MPAARRPLFPPLRHAASPRALSFAPLRLPPRHDSVPRPLSRRALQNWFHTARPLPPLNITCLGSEEGVLQDARFESGLDNSPMYDLPVWPKGGASFADDKMQLYDVGMASMHTMDCLALAELADVIGRGADAAVLRRRGEAMRGLIEANLWNEGSGIYMNKLPEAHGMAGTFSPHVAPTSFYAMQGGGPSAMRVDRMIKGWLLNTSHFCVSPSGNMAGNDDKCWWGLPSIERSDAAFPKLGYWRGFVWGPMAQLTYWGLEQYQHDVPSAGVATKALCSQMNAMMLEQWRNHGHICENCEHRMCINSASSSAPLHSG